MIDTILSKFKNNPHFEFKGLTPGSPCFISLICIKVEAMATIDATNTRFVSDPDKHGITAKLVRAINTFTSGNISIVFDVIE